MQAAQGLTIGLYAASCGIAFASSLTTASIVRMVRSRALKIFWATFTIACLIVELAHAGFTFALVGLSYDKATTMPGVILLAASIIFLLMTKLMRASIIDAQQVPILKQLAFQDALTSVGNRRAFDETLRDAAGWPIAAITIMDIDYFKAINDTQGHEVGDLVLKHVAAVIATATRGYRLYRIGGEEFAIVAPVGMPVASSIAEDCRLSVEGTPLVYARQRLCVTVSVGTAVSRPNEDMMSVMRRADEALYFAKSGGRNQVSKAA